MTDQRKPQAEAPRVGEATWCEDCDHLHPDQKGHPRYWMCLKHPRYEGFGFVTRTKWDRFSPYMYAADINSGACPLFTPKGTEQ